MKKLVLVLLLSLVTSAASADIFTWKDGKGTVYYTNSLHEIPARYRSRAKLLDVASGKKLPIPAGAGQQAPTQAAAPGTAPAPSPVAALPTAPAAAPAQPAAGQPGSVQQLRSPQAPAEQRPGFTIVPSNPAPTPAASSAAPAVRVPVPHRRVRLPRQHEDDE